MPRNLEFQNQAQQLSDLFVKPAEQAFSCRPKAAFVSRGLPRTVGWNGAATFDEGRSNRTSNRNSL